MKEAEAIVVHEAGAVARPADVNAGTVVNMIQTVLDRGITTENAAALEKLVGLCERMQDRQAQREFAEAFIELKKDMPKIEATKPVPNKDGSVRYKFAPLEEIEEKLRPVALKHGFTWTYSEGPQVPQKISKVCTVIHVGGHSQSNAYTVRIGSGPPGSSESQSDGAAHSYAKRGALCDAFGIVVAHQDTDARMEGDKITEEEARELQMRVTSLGANEKAFLAFARARTYNDICSANYPLLCDWLAQKERKK